MLLVSSLIDETMTNWSKLQHACGSAGDLPTFLGALSPNAEDPVWDELWGRVCHQGTVYSASAPVLPYLLSAAREWPPVARVTPLSLAGAIVISPNVSGSHDLQPHRSTIEGLHRLATETTASIGLSSTDFIYLLQAVLALEGDLLWGQHLHRLASGEFEGKCTWCGIGLLVGVGQYGSFVASEDWINKPTAPRNPLQPSRVEDLDEAARRLHNYALAALQQDVAQWVPYIFGVGACPTCGESMEIAKAIAAVD